jgi:hypothetical protein
VAAVFSPIPGTRAGRRRGRRGGWPGRRSARAGPWSWRPPRPRPWWPATRCP